MLASQRPSYHAEDTEIGFIKFTQLEELIDDTFLTIAATCFGDKTWVLFHRSEIEIPAEAVEYGE